MFKNDALAVSFICLSLIIVSFVLELGISPAIPTIIDYRTAKEFLALIFAGGIVLWALCSGRRVTCSNPWLAGLLGYMLIHPFLSPSYTLFLFQHNVAGYWEWKPILYAFIYFLLFCVVSNLQLIKQDLDNIFKTVMWIGFISALYISVQALHLDEFQRLSGLDFARCVTNGTLTATFTQPNYAGAFIALAIPLAVYFRRWGKVCVMAAAVALIDSKMAFLGGAAALWYLMLRWNWKIAIAILVGVVVSILILSQIYPYAWEVESSGRFPLWLSIAHDITHKWIGEKACPLFGYGLGSYRELWVPSHPMAMTEAHNEFLQFTFDAGLVGAAFLFFSIFWLLKRISVFTITDSQTITLIACFLGILACSVGLFMWQIEPHRFLSVIVFALLHNKLNINREERQ